MHYFNILKYFKFFFLYCKIIKSMNDTPLGLSKYFY